MIQYTSLLFLCSEGLKEGQTKYMKWQFLPRAKAWGFTFDFLGELCSLRQIILEKEAIVENVAGTTLDMIAPTKDLLLSSDSLH